MTCQIDVSIFPVTKESRENDALGNSTVFILCTCVLLGHASLCLRILGECLLRIQKTQNLAPQLTNSVSLDRSLNHPKLQLLYL